MCLSLFARSVRAVGGEARVEGWNENSTPLTPLIRWIMRTDYLGFGEYKGGQEVPFCLELIATELSSWDTRSSIERLLVHS